MYRDDKRYDANADGDVYATRTSTEDLFKNTKYPSSTPTEQGIQ